MDTPPEGLTYASARGRWVVAATVLGSGMAMLDGTVVGLALPVIGRDFDATVTTLQWVVNAYTLTLAGFLLLGGTLGDRFGRRLLFVLGTIGFTAASLLCGVAWSAPVLVAARAMQGLGAALLTPGSLAILQASFAPADRSRAIGAWTGFGGIAGAIGPFIGGVLIGTLSWRVVFFINLPVALVLVPVSLRHVPESRDPSPPGPLDLRGAALAALGLAGVTHGLTDGPVRGWSSAPALIALVCGTVFLLAFVAVERRQRQPLLPLALFGSRQFSAANGVTFVVYGALGGTMFLLPVALQQVAGYSPLQAGTALLPLTLIMLLLSSRSGALAARIGPRLQMSVGPLIVAVGLALFVRLDASGGYVSEVLPAVVIFGLGLATTVAPLTSTVLAAVPAEHVGVASAVNNDVARIAALVAVAVLPPIAGITGTAYRHADELARGFHCAVTLAAGACVLAGAIAAITIRDPAARS